MTLATTINNAVKVAKNSTESLWQGITYRDQGAPSYNPVSGENTQSSSDYSIDALITRYSQEELGDHALSTDLQAIILVEDLEPIPSKDDKVVYNSSEYAIIDFNKDVSQSLWYLQLR